MSDLPKSNVPQVPLVFGVVGHRDPRPEDHKALREALQVIFRGFREAYPNTPQVLLSALAEGADQLAAEVALECGVTVRAPLPFPPDVYAETTSFSPASGGRTAGKGGAAAEQMLRWVREEKVESLVVPMPKSGFPAHSVKWSAMARNATRRRTCYANAGGYIVRHCHVLIALWDEDCNPLDASGAPKVSGTAELVALKLHGKVPALYPWSEPMGLRGDRGPVCVVHTPRGPNVPRAQPGLLKALFPGERQPQPGSVLWLRVRPWGRFIERVATSLGITRRQEDGEEHPYRDLSEALALGVDDPNSLPTPEVRQFREACVTIDEFNARASTRIYAAKLRNSGDAIWVKMGFPADEPTDDKIPPLRRAARLREIAAMLARQLDAQMNLRQWMLFGCIFAAVFSFHCYAHLPKIDGQHLRHPAPMLWLFLAALVAAAAIVCEVWWRRLDESRLDYRALAEALRVRCFWALAGLEDSVADSYLGQLRGEMAWARRAIRTVCPPPQIWREEFDGLADDERKRRIEIVRRNWVIEQQKNFYEAKAHENHRLASRYRLASFALAVFGWILAMTLLYNVDHEPQYALQSHEGERAITPPGAFPHHEVLFWSGLLVLTGGFLLVICERRFHEELSKQYERMCVVFADGGLELELARDACDIARAQRTIRALGHEAITEHAQWLILRRARPFELHIA